MSEANYVHVVPNSKRPYLYSGSCEACGRVATPEAPLIAIAPVNDAVGIIPDTRWRCTSECQPAASPPLSGATE